MVRISPVHVPLILALFACGGGAVEAVRLTPLTPEQTEVFEDGVDLVADPESLQGRWREEWSRDLDRRVTWADVIAVVTVGTMRTDTDLDGQTTFRLVAEVGRELLGDAPDELELVVAEHEAGFGTVDGNSRQILDAEFVAFLKWYEAEDGRVAPHWHLSPASDPVVNRTEYLIERRRDIPRERGDERTTTIVHSAE